MTRPEFVVGGSVGVGPFTCRAASDHPAHHTKEQTDHMSINIDPRLFAQVTALSWPFIGGSLPPDFRLGGGIVGPIGAGPDRFVDVVSDVEADIPFHPTLLPKGDRVVVVIPWPTPGVN